VRQHIGDEIYTLEDYRRRYAQTKLDLDQQAAHAAAPWLMSWDDHEVDNNWVQSIDQDGTPPEVFALRRYAAFQAYYEAMPLRKTSFPGANGLRLHRRFDFGSLLRVHVLDTRQYRSDQPCGDSVKPFCPEVDAPQTTILGAEQEAWLNEGLDSSKATFNLLAQQIMVMHLDRRESEEETVPVLNHDSWNGYRAARARLMRRLDERGQRNVVIATGDEHQHFAGNVYRLPERSEGPVVATEFVTTSITSNGDGEDLRRGWDKVLARNPHCKLANNQRGYTLTEITPKAWTTSFKVLDQVRQPGGRLSVRAKFTVEPGKPGWVAA
jgi:alkaline phosphatase D